MSAIEVITSVQRRYRWSPEEKRAILEEVEQPGNSISSVARGSALTLTCCFVGANSNVKVPWSRSEPTRALFPSRR